MATVNFILYVLAVLTCLACTVLRLRGYRASRQRLLLWSALCFVFLALNNFVVVLDMLVYPDGDLRLMRHVLAAAGVLTLLYGFVIDQENVR